MTDRQKGREILSSIKEEPKNISEIINQVQKLKFEENDDMTQNNIKAFYDNITNQVFTENERENLWINQLNKESIWVKGNEISAKKLRLSNDEWQQEVIRTKKYFKNKDEEIGYKSKKYKFIKERKKQASRKKLVSKERKTVEAARKEFL